MLLRQHASASAARNAYDHAGSFPSASDNPNGLSERIYRIFRPF